MASDPLMKVQLEGAEAVFMLGADDNAKTVENVDVEVILDDGSRWSATFLSLAEIGRIMSRWKTTGECLGGSYFQCSDLVVVGREGLDAMTEVLRGLLESGQLRNVLTRVDIEE